MAAITGRRNDQHVLVVDDEPTVRGLIEELLRSPGRVVTAFGNPTAALAFLQNNRVDIAFLDLMMPGMTGLELAKRLKQVHPRARVVICTGSLPENYTAMTLATEVDRILQKPFNVAALVKLAESFRTD